LFSYHNEEYRLEWRKRNEELCKFQSSQNINRVSKLRVTWMGHVACGREENCMQNIIEEMEKKTP
jgi:hypothetical protein